MNLKFWIGLLGVLVCGRLLAEEAGIPPHKPYGIPKRIPWTTSRVVGSPEPPPPFRAVKTFTKIPFDHSLYVIELPGTRDLLVIQQNGKILRFLNDPDAAKSELFLDVGQEAYGLTFHPKFAENGQMFVLSNGTKHAKDPKTAPKQNCISRFTVSRKPTYQCDPKSEFVILEWPSNGHNGGEPAFGPDGMLYVPAGDGTSDSDTDDTGQDLKDLNAVMIRIDVDHPAPGKTYAIPADNPFVNVPGARPEIWAYGFRNPWRATFDARTGHLWVGNIGQDQWEMIHLVRKAENYGWAAWEGGHPFHSLRKLGPTPVVKPTIEHPHSEARSITGGIVYYGPLFPELQGCYLYGDYSTGKIWAAKHDGEKLTIHREIADTTVQILGFGTDWQGNIFLADYAGGISKLERAPEVKNPPKFPTRLSETGLFASVAGHRVDPALIPYSVNAPLWSDGSMKERFIALPGDSQIDYTSARGWNCPEETVLVKSFSLEMEAGNPKSRRYIETRLMTKQQGEWVGYSYVWNDEQTDAELVGAKGLEKSFTIRDPGAPGGVREQPWRYPSRADCMVCHSRAANYVLGLSELQFNRDHDYGGIVDNQLRTLEHLNALRMPYAEVEKSVIERFYGFGTAFRRGVVRTFTTRDVDSPRNVARVKLAGATTALLLPREFDRVRRVLRLLARRTRPIVASNLTHVPLLAKRPQEYTRLVDPYDSKADLETRVRSYLHSNCSVCHIEAGGGNSRMQLDFTTARDKMAVLDVKPQHNAFGLTDPRVIAPGSPERSVMYYRLSRRGPNQMPPLATTRVDEPALKLFREWIQSLPATPAAK